MNRTFIAKLLLENNILQEELDQITQQAQSEGKTLNEFLVREQFLSESDLLRIIAEELDYEFVSNPLSLHDESSQDLIGRERQVLCRK